MFKSGDRLGWVRLLVAALAYQLYIIDSVRRRDARQGAFEGRKFMLMLPRLVHNVDTFRTDSKAKIRSYLVGRRDARAINMANSLYAT